MKRYAILGAGGFAKEACLYILDIAPESEIFFIDDRPASPTLKLKGREFKVTSDWEWAASTGALFTIGVGIPKTKAILVAKALKAGLRPAATFVHPRAVVPDPHLGVGGIVCPCAVITADVRVGDYVLINCNAVIGHDSVVGDYVTCNPNSNVSGNTTLGKGIYFGVGAATKEGVSIADDVVVGGQAFVTKDITENGVTLVGIPAKALGKK